MSTEMPPDQPRHDFGHPHRTAEKDLRAACADAFSSLTELVDGES